VTVAVDQSAHPSHGKGRPSCPTCRGVGVVVIADSARGRAAGLTFPGAFQCACVNPYQAKLARRRAWLVNARRERARACLQKHPREEIDVADLVELQLDAEEARLELERDPIPPEAS